MSDTAQTPEGKIVFRKSEKTVDVQLLSMPGSRVTLRMDMTSEEAEKISLSMPEADLDERTANIVVMRITIAAMFVSWNLTEEDGQDLPCSIETLRKFNFKDLAIMFQAISGKQILDSEGNFLQPDVSKKKPSNA